jgi:hypothetical protein
MKRQRSELNAQLNHDLNLENIETLALVSQSTVNPFGRGKKTSIHAEIESCRAESNWEG